jgi:hypothetical protein
MGDVERSEVLDVRPVEGTELAEQQCPAWQPKDCGAISPKSERALVEASRIEKGSIEMASGR